MQNFKNEWKVFKSLFVIQTKFWFANPLHIFLGVFISIYTALCWLAFKEGDPFLMISGIGVAMVRNSMYIYLRTLVDWKSKGFRDKLNMTNLNQTTKQLSLLAFNIVSTILICLLLFLISIACFPSTIDHFKLTNGWMLLSGLLLCWITCYLVAILLYLTIKHPKWCVMVGLLVYVTSMYFLGLGFPFNKIVELKWLNYLVYLHPIRYSMNIIQAGYIGATDFNFVGTGALQDASVNFGYASKEWLPFVLSIIVIIICSFIIFVKSFFEKKYKFQSKNVQKRIKSESKAYIKRIKETNDVQLLKEIREDRLGEI